MSEYGREILMLNRWDDDKNKRYLIETTFYQNNNSYSCINLWYKSSRLEKKEILRDLSQQQVFEIMKELSKKNFLDFKCFVEIVPDWIKEAWLHED